MRERAPKEKLVQEKLVPGALLPFLFLRMKFPEATENQIIKLTNTIMRACVKVEVSPAAVSMVDEDRSG